MDTRRLFLSIELSDKWKQYLVNWVQTQPNYFPWIPLDYWHITVQYLGEIEESDILSMSTELEQIFKTQTEFFLYFLNICHYPRHEPPMIWAKVKQSEKFETIKEYATQTTNLYMRDIPDHRKSKPHITLAKLQGEYDVTRLKFPSEKPPHPVLHVTNIQLWESYIDIDKRRKYRCLKTFKLKSA